VADFQFPVEAGHILCFARAAGDPNPVYSDPHAAQAAVVGGIIAPPTFAQASAQFDPGYPLRPRIGEAWFGSGATGSGVPAPQRASGGGGLHAEQHFEYVRPLRPGDVLTVTTRPGETWEKQGRRGGKLIFTEQVTEYRDGDGELVVRARGVGVRPEKAIEQEAG
jgi:acyl dehydratase